MFDPLPIDAILPELLANLRQHSAVVLRAFFAEVAARATFDRHSLLADNLAPAMARRHADLFDACITDERSSR